MRIKPRAIAAVLCMIFFVGFAVCGVVRSTDKETSEIKQSYPVLAEAEPVIMADLLMESPNLTPEVKNEPDYPLTQEEIDLIALVTMGEAEGETELGKRLVIDTILNRIDHPSFPDTVYDVIYQPNQFSVMWNSRIDRCYVMPEIVELVKEELLERTNYDCVFFIYNLSTKIINGSANCFFGEAYNVSYTDVYDFSSKKQSLKKFEIELGIHHQELGLPWDKPVPEELWTKVAEYCDNDVIATEATFNARKADFTARQILADVAGMSVNDTTNSLTTRIIFGNNRKPQDQFNYRFMGDESQIFDPNADLPFTMGLEDYDEFTQFDKNHRPIFPGYTFEGGKSVYRGEEVGEGGYVYSEPGMYSNIALLDIASMHPSSIVAEELFGPEYTKRFNEILQARIAIKHKDFDKAKKMLGGALAKYLTDENAAADLAQALKIAINSVYGLTSAGFENPFRDNRNKDNIMYKATRKARKISKKEKATILDARQMLSYLGWINCTDTYLMYRKWIKPCVSFQQLKRKVSRYDKYDEKRVYQKLVSLYTAKGGKSHGVKLQVRREHSPTDCT